MTSQEKLQQLFEAALKDSSDINRPPTRVGPQTAQAAVLVTVPEPAASLPVLPVGPVAIPEARVYAPVNAGLDHATSAELAQLLDEQNGKKAAKYRNEMIVALTVCLALTGGAYGWFVQSPSRVQTVRETFGELRTVGDVEEMASNYGKALDKVGGRSKELEEATSAMGTTTDQSDEKDPHMEAEMLAMMGGTGKTAGQRNHALQQKFDEVAREELAPDEP